VSYDGDSVHTFLLDLDNVGGASAPALGNSTNLTIPYFNHFHFNFLLSDLIYSSLSILQRRLKSRPFFSRDAQDIRPAGFNLPDTELAGYPAKWKIRNRYRYQLYCNLISSRYKLFLKVNSLKTTKSLKRKLSLNLVFFIF
jgi:hypothetical protein